MPKKTKKEKIIAELRRRLETARAGREEVKYNPPPIPQPSTSISAPNVSLPLSTSTTSYIIHDLRKTFLLSGLAISLELVLYLIWR
ncbi:MAG: hypothetical protein LiPW16_226 [Microgenomates group bacterium LiPW_16]|nr:MAG: hypothetical protein LiPW16_226 [Microgenomates group bacterium LiPW_16]